MGIYNRPPDYTLKHWWWIPIYAVAFGLIANITMDLMLSALRVYNHDLAQSAGVLGAFFGIGWGYRKAMVPKD